MLTHLTIKNYALVESLDLDFGSGMTVVTGETGAGKSIMLDALALTLGDRADTALIARGAERAEISSAFSLGDNNDVRQILTERDIPLEDEELILRRVVTKEGRSRAYINGVPSTLADLRLVGEWLVDIHSQHEHQSLLVRETHQRLLDEYGGLQNEASKLRGHFDEVKRLGEQLDRLRQSASENGARLQLLNYQATELAELDLQPGELTELQDEQKQLSHADNDQLQIQTALQVLAGDDNALDSINRAIAALAPVNQPGLAAIVEVLESGVIQLDEATHDLSHFAEQLESDPARLQVIEARLDHIYTVARKHHIDAINLVDLQQQITAELAQIDGATDEIEQLEQRLAQATSQYDKLAGKLGTKRRKAATKLQKAVTTQLADLGMHGATLSIVCKPRENRGQHGTDDIEFLIATNAGQTPGPLNRVASGGELSRISLAIQVETAGTSETPTLVFDEVDVGIGGSVAEVVGNRLRKLGDSAQIICVTHLAQVAAQGHQHFSVAKSLKNKKSITTVQPLDQQETVAEIARMMGGLEVTEQTTAHAQEMYDKAQRR